MKQIARIRMNGGNTQIVKLKRNASHFDGPDGLKYNAPNKPGEWGIEKGFWGPVQEALYLEGIPQPIGAKEIDALGLNGHGDKPIKVRVRVPGYEGFSSDEFTKIYGEPIQMWLANAIQRAQGGLTLQYAQLGLSGVCLLVVGWCAYVLYKHTR